MAPQLQTGLSWLVPCAWQMSPETMGIQLCFFSIQEQQGNAFSPKERKDKFLLMLLCLFSRRGRQKTPTSLCQMITLLMCACVLMYVRTCVYMCTCMFMYVMTCMCVCMLMYVKMRVYVCMFMYVRTCVHIDVCEDMCIHVVVCEYMYVHVNVCQSMYLYVLFLILIIFHRSIEKTSETYTSELSPCTSSCLPQPRHSKRWAGQRHRARI